MNAETKIDTCNPTEIVGKLHIMSHGFKCIAVEELRVALSGLATVTVLDEHDDGKPTVVISGERYVDVEMAKHPLCNQLTVEDFIAGTILRYVDCKYSRLILSIICDSYNADTLEGFIRFIEVDIDDGESPTVAVARTHNLADIFYLLNELPHLDRYSDITH